MKYYIYSFEHLAWWCPSHRGYTRNIADAGEYDSEEAHKILEEGNYKFNKNPQSVELPNEALVPVPVCSDCGGTGEVATDEDDGEGHIMRGVGTRKCHCKK